MRRKNKESAEINKKNKGGREMDKKNIAIIVLSIAFLIAFMGYISTSIKANKIAREKDEFIHKIRETEALTIELSKNVYDLKSIIGKAQKEKEELEKKTLEMKEEAEDLKEKLGTQTEPTQ